MVHTTYLTLKFSNTFWTKIPKSSNCETIGCLFSKFEKIHMSDLWFQRKICVVSLREFTSIHLIWNFQGYTFSRILCMTQNWVPLQVRRNLWGRGDQSKFLADRLNRCCCCCCWSFFIFSCFVNVTIFTKSVTDWYLILITFSGIVCLFKS